MENNFDKLLNSDLFDDDIKTAVKEAWENKVNEIKSSLKKDIEKDVRREFKEMYKNDSNNLVEAMDKLLSEAVSEYSKGQLEATKQLEEEKISIAKELVETRKEYKDKLAKSIDIIEAFVLESLKPVIEESKSESKSLREERVRLIRETQDYKEIQSKNFNETMSKLEEMTRKELTEKIEELEKSKKSLEDEKEKSKEEVDELKEELKKVTESNLNNLNNFVIAKLKEELEEFNEDKKALNERRIQFESEAKAKLDEEKRRFISVSKSLVAETVYNALKTEMEIIKEDIKASANNNFGRHIFEAFKKEFYISKLGNEKSIFHKLNEEKIKLTKELQESKDIINKQTLLVERSNRLASIAKDESIRIKTLNELCKPLNVRNKEIMESLLSTVKTEKLEESFNKFLPSMINGKNVDFRTNEVLNEHKGLNNSRVLTGNKQRQNSPSGAEQSQNILNEERQALLHLAGIKKENKE